MKKFTIFALFLAACSSSPKAEESPSAEAAAAKSAAAEAPATADAAKAAEEEKPSEASTPAKPLTAKQVALLHIESVLKRYHKTKGVKMSVNKHVRLDMLDRVTLSSGKMFFSKGQLRLEIEKPEKSDVILNNTSVWMINHLPEEFGGGVQVARMAAEAATKKAKSPLAFLLQDVSVLESFKLKEVSRSSRGDKYILVPDGGKGWSDLKTLQIQLSKKDEIIAVEYADELDNETKYAFSEIKFDQKIKSSLFKYTPPSGVDVTEY